MAKRPAEDFGAGPSLKRPHLSLAPLDIGPATGEEDLNVKVLQVRVISLINAHLQNATL